MRPLITQLGTSRGRARRVVRQLADLGLPRPTAERAVSRPLPASVTQVGSRRPLPLPDGLSREAVFELLSSLSIDRAPAEELRGYVVEDFERFLHTWSLVRDLSGSCLEIGANPYFTTVLLKEFTGLELTLTNSFDPERTGEDHQVVSYRPPGLTETRQERLTFHHVNVERHGLPFPDDSFDVVLFCEVIEHLLADPVAALLEIRRVLRPGGRLVLTTPNVARLENVARLVAGANLYDPYSGYGPYGRHNREFTRHELFRLLPFAGFDPGDNFTADVHPHAAASFTDLDALAPLLVHRHEDLGQYLFFSATRAAEPLPGRPTFLYRSLPSDQLTEYS